MIPNPLDSALYGPLFSDPEVAALFSDEDTVRAMLEVEAALARVEGRLGVIPREAANAIAAAARSLKPDLREFGRGTEKSGIPVIALVEQLRAALDAESAPFVHWGATSQDIMDTGLVLRLQRVLGQLSHQLDSLMGRLADLAEEHRNTLMLARTRNQQALPTTFGLKAVGWLLPLIRHEERLRELKPRLLLLQFGGAAGTLAALGKSGLAIQKALATELGLGLSPAPWHAQRDSLAELAGWLSLLSGSLGKMGQDITLLAQSEVGEIRESRDPQRGGSSTMPQKANPVISETLMTVARMNAGLLGTAHQALIQEQERGGAGWQLEWLTLPQMAILTGGALRQATALCQSLDVRAERMRTNIDSTQGLILAEAASFALAAHMPRPEAQKRVKEACRTAIEEGRHLIDVLQRQSGAKIDWAWLRDPANHLGEAHGFVDLVLEAHKARS